MNEQMENTRSGGQNETKRSILSVLEPKSRPLGLIVLVAEGVNLTSMAAVEKPQRLYVVLVCAVILLAALVGIFWVEAAGSRMRQQLGIEAISTRVIKQKGITVGALVGLPFVLVISYFCYMMQSENRDLQNQVSALKVANSNAYVVYTLSGYIKFDTTGNPPPTDVVKLMLPTNPLFQYGGGFTFEVPAHPDQSGTIELPETLEVSAGKEYVPASISLNPDPWQTGSQPMKIIRDDKRKLVAIGSKDEPIVLKRQNVPPYNPIQSAIAIH